ncbi:pentapeptide repeat-containing protein [Pseudoroseicyclus sp. H15]
MLWIALAAAAAFALLAITWLILRPAWMGLSGRTMWDWISLLAVPSMVALATALLTAAQFRIEQERAAEEALLSYVDRISNLVLARPEGLDAAGAAVARAQTDVILHLLEGERAGRALSFLAELEVLGIVRPPLEERALSGADLKGLDLTGADLEGSDLAGAELEEAVLMGADLESADLTGADFKDADLRGAELGHARLQRADLDHADLRGADLHLAEGLTRAQIALACLDTSTRLPDDLARPEGGGRRCTGRAEMAEPLFIAGEDDDEDDEEDDD